MSATLPDPAGAPGLRDRSPALRTVLQPTFEGRYRIRQVDGVRFLTCIEAPGIRVRIDPGVTATAHEARTAPPGTIFLDGAAACAPFVDPARRVYNLDHHVECVRAFTLSACEQAMVLVRKGLELRSREWTVRANDADLDVVLAVWVLLNHLRLGDPNDAVRREIMPLLRLEGMIDAQGLELQDLCALPPKLFDETRRRMDLLRDRERQLKSGHGWQRVDLLEFVREHLAQIDSFVYPPCVFDDLVEIEEVGRAEMGEGSVALACRTRAGVYEVERQLRRLHGPRLGLIVLEQRPGVYTLRQVDPSLPRGLDSAYAYLNIVDPGAGSTQSGNRWGGSPEIGGSPRRSGSKLSTDEVLDVCRHALKPRSTGRRLVGFARAAASMAIVLLVAWGASVAADSLLGIAAQAAFGYALGASAGLAFVIGSIRRRCGLGLRLPRGTGWLRAVPLAVAGALLGGSGLASRSIGDASPLLGLEAALPWLSAIVGTELLFRGVVHGQLVWALGPTPTRIPAATASAMREIWLSPRMLAAGMSGVMGLLLASPSPSLVPPPTSLAQLSLVLVGSLSVGLAAGIARERSESVLAATFTYAVAAAVVALVSPQMIGAFASMPLGIG